MLDAQQRLHNRIMGWMDSLLRAGEHTDNCGTSCKETAQSIGLRSGMLWRMICSYVECYRGT